jgi:hypothetical protein
MTNIIYTDARRYRGANVMADVDVVEYRSAVTATCSSLLDWTLNHKLYAKFVKFREGKFDVEAEKEQREAAVGLIRNPG